MKNIIWLVVAITLFITGCSDITSDEEKGSEQGNSQEETQKSTKNTADTNKNEPENGANDEEQPEEKQMDKKETTEPIYKVDEETSSVVPINEEGNEKIVLLTIDDAPDEHALNMANTLKDLEAGAIFFVNGHFLNTAENKKALQKIHDMGFAIGNHTYNHELLSDLPTEKQKEEIVSLNDKIENIIGERPQFFRAPHGKNTDYSNKLAGQEGMVTMNWTYGYDYFEPYMDAEKLTEAMVSGKGPEVDIPYSLLKPGANLLMHDREWTAKALPDIIEGLRAKGYEIVDPALIQTKE
ncbi:polysaccharide deacetylase family protein [Lentibacillus lipolyticus]|nr:polysaccharide deacetylase family protein [Lentibacillus lipolyticus]